MDEPEPQPGAAIFEIRVPPELEGGAYSNFLSVWHSPFEFTLDFAVTEVNQPTDPRDPNAPVTIPCRIVARIKIPPPLIFSVLQTLNENMSNYEAKFGEIPQPGPREGPPPRGIEGAP
jgi:hypothetical protein